MTSALQLPCKVLTTDPPGSPAYKAAMRGKIGGSAVADILGHGRATPLQRWALITEKIQDEDISQLPWIKAGNRLEPVVAQWWEDEGHPDDEPARKLAPAPGTLQHPRLKFLAGTPDRMILEGRDNPAGIWEGKTTAGFFKADWEDQVPTKHQIQIHVYMAITGLRWGSFGALAGNEFLWKDCVAEENFIDWMESELEQWWEKYVIKDIPPPTTGHESEAKTLARLHPNDNGQSVILSRAAVDATELIENWSIKAKEVDRVLEEQKNLIRAEMGDNSFGIGPNFVWAWKTQDRKEYTVAASSSRVLRKQKAAK